MRKLWLGIVGLAAATTANAAVVTYTLSYNDFGAGTQAIGSYAVYASVSNDAAGLYGFGVDLTAFTGTIANRANGIVYSNPDTDANQSLGFTVQPAGGRDNPPISKVFAVQDVSLESKPVYGIGQEANNLISQLDPGFTVPGNSFGGGGAPYGQQTYEGRNLFLLARGTWTGAVRPDFERSIDSSANVYVSRTTGLANTPATIEYDYRDLVEPTGGLVKLATTADATTPTNVAVGGAIAVQGGNNAYTSEIDNLTADAVIKGNAPIQTIGDEAGKVFVMAKLNGTQAEIDAFLNGPTITNDLPSTDANYVALKQHYPFFNALFSFDNFAGAKVFSIDTSSAPGVSVDQLAAVPEPGMISMLCLGALGLVARRRRTA